MGKPAPDQENNPAYGAYVQAQNTWHADRALVSAYEGFADEHADRYQDVRTRLDLGKGTTADAEFARVFEEHLDEQPLAVANAASVVDHQASQLAAAEAFHAEAVAVHDEVTASG